MHTDNVYVNIICIHIMMYYIMFYMKSFPIRYTVLVDTTVIYRVLTRVLQVPWEKVAITFYVVIWFCCMYIGSSTYCYTRTTPERCVHYKECTNTCNRLMSFDVHGIILSLYLVPPPIWFVRLCS